MPAPPAGLSDDLLLREAATGDGAAFEALVHRHQASVFRFIGVLGVTGADAEDVLQEAFVAAWRGASGYEGTGSVRSWLLTIARRAAHRHRRRRAGEPPAHEPLESLDALALRAGWGDAVAVQVDERAADARACIARALARLEDDEREVLVLRDLDGLTGEEAARALQLSVPAMKSRLHRARLHLAALIREDADAQS